MYGMWHALSRRHVHGLRFQPPATGGIHRIAGGVAQEPANAQSRHAAPRVAFVPLLKPRLHVTLHPVAVIAHQVGELVQHCVAEVVEHAAQDRLDVLHAERDGRSGVVVWDEAVKGDFPLDRQWPNVISRRCCVAREREGGGFRLGGPSEHAGHSLLDTRRGTLA